MKKINNKRGFTLVELLVVMSIIAMLAALLLPAIQMAREVARRIDCTNNQRNVAIALSLHDHYTGSLPALRAPLKPKEFFLPTNNNRYDPTSLTWVGFILPYIEQTPAWDRIKSGRITAQDASTLYDMAIPVMKCKSSGVSPKDSRISFVVNAGPINSDGNTADQGKEFPSPVDNPIPNSPQAYATMYTMFFDHLAEIGDWSDFTRVTVAPNNDPLISVNYCKSVVTIDMLNAMDGTTTTILSSENMDAGQWIWRYGIDGGHPTNNFEWLPCACDGGHFQRNSLLVERRIESEVGFCYPANFDIDVDNFEAPDYVPAADLNGNWIPYRGLSYAGNNLLTPMPMNEGKRTAGYPAGHHPARTARISSGHVEGAVAAFADGHVQYLKDSIDRTLFVKLCRPSSGVIVNQNEL